MIVATRAIVAKGTYGSQPESPDLVLYQSAVEVTGMEDMASEVNADVFAYANKIGRIRKGLLADIIAVVDNPVDDIKVVRSVSFVMKDGKIYKTPLVEGK